MKEAEQIINDIKKKNFKPVYLLTGEEPFFIDYVANYIEKNCLTDDEKAFNQVILYGKEIEVDTIINHAKRYPMMADRQVVIVKEAQELARTIENLSGYVEFPQHTTLLVLCYKYKKLDGRKSLLKAIKKTGVVLETKPLYENQVGSWIQNILKERGFAILPKATYMLVEFLGNDLSKINNELEKLIQILKPDQQITPEIIEENIGFSKDFNHFELQNALCNREIKKVFQIANYFANNSKENPLQMTNALLYSYFSKVMKYHALADSSKAASVLGINPYFIKEYQLAARNYPLKKVSAILAKLRETDMKSKGVGAAGVSESDLLKELLLEIIST